MDFSVRRYFLKGALSSLIQTLNEFSDFYTFSSSVAWEWIRPINTEAIERLKSISKEEIVFSLEEIENVISLIEMIGGKLEIDSQGEKEIKRTLLYWKTLLKNLG